MDILVKRLDLGSTSLNKQAWSVHVFRDGPLFSPSLWALAPLLLAPSCWDHLPFSPPLFSYGPLLTQAHFLDGANGTREQGMENDCENRRSCWSHTGIGMWVETRWIVRVRWMWWQSFWGNMNTRVFQYQHGKRQEKGGLQILPQTVLISLFLNLLGCTRFSPQHWTPVVWFYCW